MIKFRGKVKWNGLHFFSGETIEGDLTDSVDMETSLRTFECDHLGNIERSGVIPVKSDSLEINVSGHWLKVEDLEAIVEKVMGGKGE